MANINLLLYISSYTHNDNVYAMYTFDLCIGHQVDTEVPSLARTRPSRAGGKCKADEVCPEWPVGGGGNCMDTSLRVVIKSAKGTMTCFLPEKIHGTTRLCGAHQHCITVAFSEWIADAFRKAHEGISVKEGKGAGQGDPDAL